MPNTGVSTDNVNTHTYRQTLGYTSNRGIVNSSTASQRSSASLVVYSDARLSSDCVFSYLLKTFRFHTDAFLYLLV